MTDVSPFPVRVADWLRLWRLLQQSSLRFHRALSAFGDPATALAMGPSDWRAAGIGDSAVIRLQRWQVGLDPELQRELDEGVAADLGWGERSGQQVLTLAGASYPPLLREIPDAPPLLFLRGEAALAGLPQVAIVGSRHPSHTGLADARDFAAMLGQAGLVITSGMASGIDGAAHTGALRSGARTIAVLGTGADRAYPREHHRLYQELVDSGNLVVSEYLPGTPPLAPHFPRRNRIISGLSLGVLVVEAAPDSGSLITARLAAEHGRPVWALPGSRHHAQSRGCLQIIREGATLVTESAHVLEDLPAMVGYLRQQIAAPAKAVELDAAPSLDALSRALLGLMGQEARHADWLIAMSGEAPAAVLRQLSLLEMQGLIASVPGGYERLPAGAVLT